MSPTSLEALELDTLLNIFTLQSTRNLGIEDSMFVKF